MALSQPLSESVVAKKRTLCKWKDGRVEKDLKKLRKIVLQPTLACRRCARVANDETFLCKPVPLGED